MTTQNFPYAEVFAAVELLVIEQGSERLPRKQVTNQLDEFKGFATRKIDDAEYFSTLVFVAFYSGFRATTVSERRKVIEKSFPNWSVVANYTSADVKRILRTPGMIANKRKVLACVENGKAFRDLVVQYGSFQAFLNQQLPDQSLERLLLLKELLQSKFSYLGPTTVYHFMTDIGLNVLKPDRVITRIFHRLGLLENESLLLKAILEGRKFSEATGHPIRYIDIVFVLYGQVKEKKFGIRHGVCLLEPRCDVCSIRKHCTHPAASTAVVAA